MLQDLQIVDKVVCHLLSLDAEIQQLCAAILLMINRFRQRSER